MQQWKWWSYKENKENQSSDAHVKIQETLTPPLHSRLLILKSRN
jgi:hypothetical protein